MSTVLVLAIAARALSLAFGLLVIAGLWSRARRFIRTAGYRRAAERASQRFALGEIDAETLRRLRADLVGARF